MVASDHAGIALEDYAHQSGRGTGYLGLTSPCADCRVLILPLAKAWSNVLVIKVHKGLQARDVSKESLRFIASRWTLSYFSKYRAFG
jgi:hypothetical protein